MKCPLQPFLFLCKGLHVFKPRRLQVYYFDKVCGDLDVWDRHNPDGTSYLSAAFPSSFVLWERNHHHPPPFLHHFDLRLHQSSSPSLLLTCTFLFGVLITLSLHAQMQNNFSYQLRFFSVKQIILEPFFPFLPPPPPPKKR